MEEQVVAYLRRLSMLRGQQQQRRGSGVGSGAGSEVRSVGGWEWAGGCGEVNFFGAWAHLCAWLPPSMLWCCCCGLQEDEDEEGDAGDACPECGRCYPHEHVRAVYGAQRDSSDEGGGCSD